MRKFFSFFLIIISLFHIFPFASADSLIRKGIAKDSIEYYTIGKSAHSFTDVYSRMHVYLDLKTYPVPDPETTGYEYTSGQHEEIKVLKDDDDSFDYIGYVCNSNGTKTYIIWSWAGYHEDGSLIGVDTYYTLDGVYLGNVQRDFSSGAALSSRNSPYFFNSGSLDGKK